MRTIEKTVYQFSELSDSAKEKARDWYRQSDIDCYWAESVIEDAATLADIIGIDLRTRPVKLANGSTRYEPCVYWSGFWSQGDGACFEGSYRYKSGALKALKAHIGNESKGDRELLRICKGLQDLQKRYFYKLVCHMVHRGHYQHSGCMQVDSGHSADWDMNIDGAEDDLKQYMRDFADWIYSQLEQEYDYQNSDAVIEENIIANEYEFDEMGEIV